MNKPTSETHEEYNLSNEQVREAEKRGIFTPAGRMEQGIFILCLPKSKEGLQACFIRELGRHHFTEIQCVKITLADAFSL